MGNNQQLTLKRTDRIGYVAAEEDAEVLTFCFVNNEDELKVLLNPADPRCVILGRTGAGKTALLLRISETEERVIEVKPENLAIEHVANSTILRFLAEDLEIRLDVFFKLLWRHVFAVELIKRKFDLKNQVREDEFKNNIINDFFRTEEDKRAIRYLERYGSSFWQETDARVREVTSAIEQSFEGELGLTAKELGYLKVGDKSNFSEERKTEIRHRAYKIIGDVQARRLAEIIGVVESILDDPQKIYYINIDKLDENWVDDELRYKLIRSLLDTIREFNTDVYSLKVNVAIRLDLVKRVYEATRDTGFQEEKYESLYVPLEWSRDKLIELLDLRVGYLFQSKYTKQEVTYSDVLPDNVGGQNTVDYILDRTLLRPRDVILFFNECIIHLRGDGRITEDIVKRAEVSYSESRYKSLGDEWGADYPHLLDFAQILRLKNKKFKLSTIRRDDVYERCIKIATTADWYSQTLPPLSIAQKAKDFIEDDLDFESFRRHLFMCFFNTSLVGIKSETYNDFRWTTSYHSSVSEFDVTENAEIAVHPTFWSVLGIRGDNCQTE